MNLRKTKHNTLLLSALVPKSDHKMFEDKCKCPVDKKSNSLGLVSGLYLYTNTPPLAYGTPAPKVAETVLRAYKYNLKKSRKTINIGGFEIERLNWEEEDGPFPTTEVHGNFDPITLKNMSIEFLRNNFSVIKESIERSISKALTTNADILTIGRQTLCCFTDQSVTASVAYERFYRYLQEGLEGTTMSLVDWVSATIKVLDRNVYDKTEQRVILKPVRRYDSELGQKINVTKREVKTFKTKKAISNEQERLEMRKEILWIYTKFASYLKNKERGKVTRRAIASPNMAMRSLLRIIEDVHLELGKMIEGSTISIGGEEKKRKIKTNLMEANILGRPAKYIIQGTEDATKWNECLAPAAFSIMHLTFVDPKVREYLRLPEPTANETLFGQLSLLLHFFQAIKSIKLGPGPLATSEGKCRRLEWDEPIERFNEKTREWLTPIIPRMKGNYVFCSPGMLMGMLNAASTTLGLLATGYLIDKSIQNVVTLRSSDDSATTYMGTTKGALTNAFHKNITSLQLIGINMSLSKTLLAKSGYYEYTSWYCDGKFISQFGVETSAIRPQGKNPADDFYSAAIGTAISLSTLTNNHIGANMRLLLGIGNVRRLYRIQKDSTKREGVKPTVLLLSDGGTNVWHVCNCSLLEIPLKEKFVRNQTEREYLHKVMNPENPFSSAPEEDIMFSREKNSLVSTITETPRNIFTWVRRSNRTSSGLEKSKAFQKEKDCGSALNILRTADPTVYLEYPRSKTLMSNHIIGLMSVMKSECNLDEDEKKEFVNALYRLKEGVQEEEEGLDDFFSDLV
nr:TPA_asm: polymerase PB1 [Cotesiavirus orthomyxi]